MCVIACMRLILFSGLAQALSLTFVLLRFQPDCEQNNMQLFCVTFMVWIMLRHMWTWNCSRIGTGVVVEFIDALDLSRIADSHISGEIQSRLLWINQAVTTVPNIRNHLHVNDHGHLLPSGESSRVVT